MKTLFLYDSFGENEVVFFEVEGDYSKFDGVYINSCAPEGYSDKEYEQLQDELWDLLYDSKKSKWKYEELEKPTKDWDVFIKCGFIP